jgi:opacity protein-like surface antigen
MLLNAAADEPAPSREFDTMSFKKRILLVLAASIGSLASAHAADYDPPIYVDQPAEYVPVEIGSGWYLRGDVGYVFNASIGQVDYSTYDGFVYGSSSFDTQDLSADFTWGGGVGYRFTDYLRADATVDGYRASFDGSTSSAESCFPANAAYDNTSCRSQDSSEVSVVSVMANGYVDLGTYVGITPYLGAGVGYSYLSWGNLDSNSYCVDGTSTCASIPAAGVVGSESHGGEDGWRFTYAVMAGFAYDLTRNFKLDVGYKYRQIDGGDMFAWAGGSGASGVQGTSGDLTSHEFKLGLRYELW